MFSVISIPDAILPLYLVPAFSVVIKEEYHKVVQLGILWRIGSVLYVPLMACLAAFTTSLFFLLVNVPVVGFWYGSSNLCPATVNCADLYNEAQAPTAQMAVTPPSIRKSAPTTYVESSDAR